jgi:hypothetical protein
MNPDALTDAERVQRAVDAVRVACADPLPEHEARLAGIARDLRDVPPAVHSEGQILALTGVCRYFQARDRDSGQALEAAVLLSRRALALGRPHERLSGLLTQALIHDELDNHLEAVEAYSIARGVAREAGLPRGEVVSLVLGAQTLRQSGDPAGAAALAERALLLADRTDDVDDLRALAWLTMAQWRLVTEQADEGLEAVTNARRCIDDHTDAGVRARIDFTEVLLRLLARSTQDLEPLLNALDRDAKQMRTVEAALCYTAARGAVGLVQGASAASMRLVTALERARCVPRVLPDILVAVMIARSVAGDEERAGLLRDELRSLHEARRTSGQLKATLLRGPTVGLGALGRAFDMAVYQRRLDQAQRALLEGSP